MSGQIFYNFFSILLLLWVSRVKAVVSDTYALDTEYSGSTFFDGFEFWTDPDPTHGFVSYQSYSSSLAKSLISTSNNVAHMGVDYTTTLNADGSQGGRQSVRISSKKTFTHGLFVADIKHMPGGACGVWPAFWTFGPDWPNSGEIDIIEGVNLQQTNVMTAHTGDTCVITGLQSLGTLQSNDCNQNHGYGCSITSGSSLSYGDAFNGPSSSGGVYAMQWTSDYIRIWFFPRSSIPSNLLTSTPDPSTWGLPDANFQGNCDIDKNFKDHQIVFDTTFCGDWAGSVWGNDGVCGKKAGTCVEYVAQNPAAFEDSYWDINYVKVFTLADVSTPTSTKSTSNSDSTAAPVLASTTAIQQPSTPTSTTFFPPFPTSSLNITIPNTSTHPSIEDFSYIGCLSSTSFPTFTLQTQNENMTIALCAKSCQSFAYLGVYDTSCYCGSELTGISTLSDTECSTPCPGAPTQTCGGLKTASVNVNSNGNGNGNGVTVNGVTININKRSKLTHNHKNDHLHKRQGVFFLLTVYLNINIQIGVTPSSSAEVYLVPSSLELPTPSTTLVPQSTLIGVALGADPDGSVVQPAGTLIGIGMGGGLAIPVATKVVYTTYKIALTTTYTDICQCAASTLQVYTTTSTLTITRCGCDADKTAHHPSPHYHAPVPETKHEIPMTTVTRLCADCGQDGRVIVTVPSCTDAPSHPTVYPQPQTPYVYIATVSVIPLPPVAPQVDNSNGNGNGSGNQTFPTLLVISNKAEGRVSLIWTWGVGAVLGVAGAVVWAL